MCQKRIEGSNPSDSANSLVHTGLRGPFSFPGRCASAGPAPARHRAASSAPAHRVRASANDLGAAEGLQNRCGAGMHVFQQQDIQVHDGSFSRSFGVGLCQRQRFNRAALNIFERFRSGSKTMSTFTPPTRCGASTLSPTSVALPQPMPQPRAQCVLWVDTALDRGRPATRRRPGLSGA